MKLISEIVNPVSLNDYEVIVEQTNKNTPMKLKVKGVFISCDVKNVNGRIYEFDYMNEDVIPEYDRVWISQHRAYGELNHAQSHVVNPKDACFLIESLKPEGKNFIGEAIVLNSDSRLGTPGTPNGDILAAILLHGGKMGVSTRGAVEDPQNNIINKHNLYSLITIDSVLDPSRSWLLYQ